MKHLLSTLICCAFMIFSTINLEAQWQSVNIVVANNKAVSCMANSDTTLFAGTNGSGIYLSADNGATWTESNTGLGNLVVNALAVSGTNILAGTSGGLFLSVDNGSSWSNVKSGEIRSLAVRGTDAFAGSTSGVYMSANSGFNWTSINNGAMLSSYFVYGLAVSDTNVFAGTIGGEGVFLTTNNGAGWTAAGAGLNNKAIKQLTMNDTNIYALTNLSGIYFSRYNGTSWTGWAKITTLLSASPMSLALSGTTIYTGALSDGIYSSDDNGASWSAFNDGWPQSTTASNLFLIETDLYAAPATGLWKRSLTTGMEEINGSLKMAVYPNPAHDKIAIESNQLGKESSLSLYNLSGQIVSYQLIKDKKTQIDIRNLPVGVYFIKLVNEKTVRVCKFIRE